MLLAAGRMVRHRLLLGPDGAWRDELWLDGLLESTAPTASDHAEPARPVLTGPLPLNTCSEDSLTLLPGVGPVLAERIAASRTAAGPFGGPGDLRRVRGIGPVLAARLAPHLDFGAAADSCGLHDPR
jgi:hypothetical protein